MIGAGASMKRVLVVEDEAMVAMLLEDMLVDLGMEVVGVGSTVAQALTMIEAGGFDFAVIDINLAGESSYPVAELLARKQIPFVFATGYGTSGLRGDFRTHPTVGKPFRLEELSQILVTLNGAGQAGGRA
jgi:CheY-like chemotaxis protein